MAKTPIELYRSGNANSSRMDNVRPKDVATYTDDNGQVWVNATLGGGISTFATPRVQLLRGIIKDILYALKTQTLLHSPYFNRLILTTTNQSLPIPTESKTTHRVFMPYQRMK